MYCCRWHSWCVYQWHTKLQININFIFKWNVCTYGRLDQFQYERCIAGRMSEEWIYVSDIKQTTTTTTTAVRIVGNKTVSCDKFRFHWRRIFLLDFNAPRLATQKCKTRTMRVYERMDLYCVRTCMCVCEYVCAKMFVILSLASRTVKLLHHFNGNKIDAFSLPHRWFSDRIGRLDIFINYAHTYICVRCMGQSCAYRIYDRFNSKFSF